MTSEDFKDVGKQVRFVLAPDITGLITDVEYDVNGNLRYVVAWFNNGIREVATVYDTEIIRAITLEFGNATGFSFDGVRWIEKHNASGFASGDNEGVEKVYVKKRIPVKARQSMGVTSIKTLEGTLTARHGDYIVTGAGGEQWPVRRDIFEETYEIYKEGENGD